jgi:AraC family L-rhamnose operon regulatory protein RhaS
MILSKRAYKENGITYYPDACKPLTSAWKEGKIQVDALSRYNYPGYQLEPKMIQGVCSIGYWNAQTPQEWGLDWHRNEGLEITFLESGTMPYLLEGGHYAMLPNDLTITRPWQSHKVGNPNIGIGKLHWLILDVNVRQPHQEWKWPSWIMLSNNTLQKLTEALRQNEQPIFKVNSDIRRCFQKIGQIIHELSINSSKLSINSAESWIKIYVNVLLMLLSELLQNENYVLNESLTKSVRTVELFLKEFNENYFEPWTLESMSSHAGLGVTQFTHYCKQLTNRTPMQYLNSIRLLAAQRCLVANPKMSIKEICYDCGFTSTQYFSTLFSKHFGCSPSAYRQ